MNFQQHIGAFVQLGQELENWVQTENPVIERAYVHNRWFTPENTRKALLGWAQLLQTNSLEKWLESYPSANPDPKTVAILMAGNIPLVGLHDLICVLLCGHNALVKLSSDDSVLMEAVIHALIRIEPAFEKRIQILTERLPKTFDAVIATGSDNSNRYFEYYFRDKPHILRKNRNSVAVLTGNETPEDIQRLADDIFTYYGLGCRNVAKIFVPENYDFIPFFEQINAYVGSIDHHKYANNYTYHKSIFLMNMTHHLDNGFLLVKEDNAVASPLSVLFYETYKNTEELNQRLAEQKDQIQCIVGKTAGYIPFGKAQDPELWDYADGVDTMDFLLKL
ncbi:MAG: acyl-CoA reductase [Bacteroidia bacterium]|jgi:hypothetical protein